MSASAATQGSSSNLFLCLIVIMGVIILGGLVSIPASAPNAHRAANSPPVQPPIASSSDWGALEAEGIATYYATDKAMPTQRVEGVGSVIGWKDHVVERHGAETWQALWEALSQGGWSRHDCDDGKTYLTKRIPGHEDKWWFAAIGSTVIDSARLVITGFSGDRGSILAPVNRDDCKPEFPIGHDFATGS